MKKRMGRPPKPKTHRKSRTLQVRLSSAEYKKIAARAKAANLSVSEFLRGRAKD